MTRPRQTGRAVPLDTLVPHPDNARKGLGDLTDLTASIREHGLLQPIVATEHPTMHEKLLILAGHRRHAAATAAGLTSVPVIIRHGIEYDDDEHTVLMLVENCQRTDLSPVEKADAISALRKRGLTLDEIARRIGMSRSRVGALLQLEDLTAESREAVRTGLVTVKQATTVISKVRRDHRATNGHAPMGRPVLVETAYLTRDHPLARAVAACLHTARPKVGGIGCGQCWEAAIRADERTQP